MDEKFCGYFIEAEQQATELNLQMPAYRKRQPAKTLDHFYRSHTTSYLLESLNDKYKVDFFFPALNAAISEINRQFNTQSMSYLTAKKLKTVNISKGKEALVKPNKEFQCRVPEMQYDLLVHHIEPILNAQGPDSGISFLEHMKVCKEHDLELLYPDRFDLLLLLATLPVTVAMAEKCFSAKKCRLRSRLTEARLQQLLILAVETDITNSVNTEEAVDTFIQMAPRCMDFR
ncbi:hypothetical protein KIL84_007427 [Mauremys mutica]|uniref:HAT C-terminal dimerisation domain-containing protein n=1 Tax=Mauremys mutica TaxID=74926 RepID=A0A9D4AVK5_9SAUR|nr:hypothetical protein KIL84_007427 [Mauremys mutica]